MVKPTTFLSCNEDVAGSTPVTGSPLTGSFRHLAAVCKGRKTAKSPAIRSRKWLAATFAPLPALALAATAVVGAMTYDAPVGGFAPVDGVDALIYQDIAASKPANVPTWASHGGAAGCAPLVEGELVDTVLVVTQDGGTRRMSFDRAWDLAHDDTWANDVWTIGGC